MLRKHVQPATHTYHVKLTKETSVWRAFQLNIEIFGESACIGDAMPFNVVGLGNRIILRSTESCDVGQG